MALFGSSRPPLPGAESLGPVDPDERIEATLVLRRRAPLPEQARLSPAELAAAHGADPADVHLVTTTLATAGIDVVETDVASRRMRIAGPANAMEAAFGTSLTRVRRTDRTDASGAALEHRYRQGQLSLPDGLDGVVIAVLGLDDRPQADTRLAGEATPAAAKISYTPVQLAQIYALPAGTTGAGQTIAILEFGGGYTASDMDAYFAKLGLTPPTITAVGVDGANNSPTGDPSGADGEVQLDIEVAGAIAPGAQLVVYFAPNDDAGFVDALSTAAHASPTPAAISISWGQSEDSWTAQTRTALDDAMADATALGTTVLVAAGDSGSSDSGSGVHCDYPASSPYALGCGGTSLQADAATGEVSSETVWNRGTSGGSTGGGVSDVYPVPAWQANAGVPARSGGGAGRGVPDVAAAADPATGYRVSVDGSDVVFGGTSAVAPLWAGLVARIAADLGHGLGLLQPTIYAGATPGHTAPGFRDIVSGNNGAYQAAPGWDPCTGLGVPDGTALLAVLQQGGSGTATGPSSTSAR